MIDTAIGLLKLFIHGVILVANDQTLTWKRSIRKTPQQSKWSRDMVRVNTLI